MINAPCELRVGITFDIQTSLDVRVVRKIKAVEVETATIPHIAMTRLHGILYRHVEGWAPAVAL